MKTSQNKKNADVQTFEKFFRYFITAIIVLSVITAALLIFPNLRLFRTYVATVGESKVTLEEYNFFLNQAKQDILYKANPEEPDKFWGTVLEGGKTAIEVAKQQALDMVKEFKVQVAIAKERGIKLDASEVRELNKMVDQQAQMYGEDLFESIYGVSPVDFKDIYKQYALIDELRAKETEGMKVEESEIRQYYDEHPDAFTNTLYRENGEEAVWARHILIRVEEDATQEQKDEARKKAQEILEQVKSGEDFVKLVKEKSEDPGSKDYGGDYVFGKGKMQPEFEEAAFGLNPGEISDIVETANGYHIIKLEEKIEKDKPVSYECAKEYREFGLGEEYLIAEKYQAIVDEWEKDPKFEVKTLEAYNRIKG